MDTPRVVVLGAPPLAALVAAAALATGRAPIEAVFPVGLLLAVPLGAYVVMRLRRDLLVPLAALGAGLALGYLGMVAKCAGDTCAPTLLTFAGLHVGAFAAALATLMALVASAFAKELRPSPPHALVAASLAVLDFAALAGAWALR